MDKLRSIRGSTVAYKHTLDFETMRLELVECQESIVHKITIFSTVQFESLIDFEVSNIDFVNNFSQ